MTIERELTRYYRQINKKLIGSKKEKSAFLENFKNDVEENRQQHAGTGFAGIREHFGEPQEIGREYVSALDEETVHKRLSRAKAVKIAWITAIVILALAIAALGVAILLSKLESADDVVEVKVTYMDGYDEETVREYYNEEDIQKYMEE